MKTSFSVKVTGSITVSIEPSNADGGGGGGAAAAADVDDDNSGNVLVDGLLKSLVNDAVKKYAGDKGTTVEEEEDDEDHDYDGSYPVPHRRIPSDADDDEDGGEDGEEDGELKDSESYSEFAELELPTVQVDIEYDENYQLSELREDFGSLLPS
ncbi:hypothetical protein FRACYDRAFT_252692 [Fragilariopsis cylindrus CCMP1102]|uniref:Uncharacterized protein n=1 Tax=Fragilariopsis cylindrus CCMP1102 TaxID=635003 RepID=A0A1E7ELQ7_9STRA|nr:hypothetical protein FRACYDRAFT_252692 [Fragilariopsis cylindrus CCMP1102]|eukprot:OEU06852.1 hypothetical protein FRACYDRAFT_252692 [Fragilariopsis cylindrus CCMP1102]